MSKGVTQEMPKATVQLSKGTQPMNRPAAVPTSSPARTLPQDEPLYEEKDPEAGLAPLAILCTVLALGLMTLSLLGSDKIFYASPGDTTSFMVPPPDIQKWEEPVGDGTYVSSFNKVLESYTSKYK